MLAFRYAPKPYETTPEAVAKLDEADYLAQSKYDGWRMWAQQIGRDNFQCLTASGNPMEREPRAKFDPRITEQFKALGLPTDTVLDSEYVGPRGDHDPTAYIFDMLAWKGEWIAHLPYEERWKYCLDLVLPSRGIIHLAQTADSGFLDLFNRLKADWIATGCGMHLTEGIVVKSRTGIAKLDRKNRKKAGWMIKCKYREIREKRF